MTINLYSVSVDPRTLDKMRYATLINSTPITVKPTERVNLLNPVFEIDYNESYLLANYAYCDTFDTYYYVSPPHLNTGKRLDIPCTIDVRQTYKNSIEDCSGTVLRAQSLGAPTQITDTKLPINPSQKSITSIVLPETTATFNTDATYSYMLTVVGGEPEINNNGGE